MDAKRDLNFAYNMGNFIEQNTGPVPSSLQTLQFTFGHEPVVIGQTTPGAGSAAGHSLEQAFLDASIVASGYSPTPDVFGSFSHTTMGPGIITLQGSGTPANMILTAANGPFGIPFAVIAASGAFVIAGDGVVQLLQSAPVGDLTIENKGGTIQLNPFNGSGLTEYRLGLGQEEGWYVRHSDSLDYNLMPDENQVRDIVLKLLQASGIL